MDDGLVTDRYGGAANSCSYPTALSDLTDDLIEEILLRLSPEEQGCRERVSLVCKSWHRIVYDPGYRRCYFDLHRRYTERRLATLNGVVVYTGGIFLNFQP